MARNTRLVVGVLQPLITLMGACGAPGGTPVADATPARVCWALQRTIDGLAVIADTGDVPSRFELEVTPAGGIVVPGTQVRGQWTRLSADSVRAEWGEGRQRVWLFGNVRQGRFTGAGHAFTRAGASVLVTYTGARVRCQPDI